MSLFFFHIAWGQELGRPGRVWQLFGYKKTQSCFYYSALPSRACLILPTRWLWSCCLIKGRDPYVQRSSDRKELKEDHCGWSLKKKLGEVDIQAFIGQVRVLELSLKAVRKQEYLPSRKKISNLSDALPTTHTLES